MFVTSVTERIDMSTVSASCTGIVLRSTDVGDNDKLLTLLTAEYGKLTISAKGARSLKSKFMSVSQQFAYGEFTFTVKGDFKWLKDASLAESFFAVRRDLPRLALACYVASVTEQLSLEGQADVELLRLTLNTLYMLCGEKHSLDHIKAVFELSAVCVGGFSPELESCGNCGSADNITYIDTVGGVCLCESCVRKLFAETQIPVSVLPITSGELDAFRFITSPDTKNQFAFRLPDEEGSALSDLCEKYLLAQLDCGFKTLSFYHEVKN